MLPETLRQNCIRPDSRLFANREAMVESFSHNREFKKIGEIGVALGDFSAFMLETLRPEEFVAFDLFELHTFPELWGKPTGEIFRGIPHLDFFKNRMKQSQFSSKIKCRVGLSWEMLELEENQSFDLLYIDGDHCYTAVRRDAEAALKKIKHDGLLVFNDYIMWDPHGKYEYGVVPVVNDLLVNHGWQITAFAFHNQMFADIALVRQT